MRYVVSYSYGFLSGTFTRTAETYGSVRLPSGPCLSPRAVRQTEVSQREALQLPARVPQPGQRVLGGRPGPAHVAGPQRQGEPQGRLDVGAARGAIVEAASGQQEPAALREVPEQTRRRPAEEREQREEGLPAVIQTQ